MLEVARGVLALHGRALTPEALAASAGRRPLEAWQATVDALRLTEVTAQQLYDESEALLKERCAPEHERDAMSQELLGSKFRMIVVHLYALNVLWQQHSTRGKLHQRT